MRNVIFALAIGLSTTIGCGGSIVDARWNKQYCEDHKSDYHHANHICRSNGRVVDCYYAEHWLDRCAEIRNSF